MEDYYNVDATADDANLPEDGSPPPMEATFFSTHDTSTPSIRSLIDKIAQISRESENEMAKFIAQLHHTDYCAIKKHPPIKGNKKLFDLARHLRKLDQDRDSSRRYRRKQKQKRVQKQLEKEGEEKQKRIQKQLEEEEKEFVELFMKSFE